MRAATIHFIPVVVALVLVSLANGVADGATSPLDRTAVLRELRRLSADEMRDAKEAGICWITPE